MWVLVWIILISSSLVAVTSGQDVESYYRFQCKFYSPLTYDVTNNEYTIYSHDDYGYHFTYPSSYRKCIDIYTNNTDHVIKLEEVDFELEQSSSCSYDNFSIFYRSMDDSGVDNEEGTWCGKSGPGTKYSDGRYMFLYFKTDTEIEKQGFEIRISSIHEDDVPFQLSTGGIVGIVFGVVAIIAIVAVIVVYVVIQQKKKQKKKPAANVELVDPPAAGQEEAAAAPSRQNRAADTSMDTTTTPSRRQRRKKKRQVQRAANAEEPAEGASQAPEGASGTSAAPTNPTAQPLGPPPQQSEQDDPAYPQPARFYSPAPRQLPPITHQQTDDHPPPYDSLYV